MFGTRKTYETSRGALSEAEVLAMYTPDIFSVTEKMGGLSANEVRARFNERVAVEQAPTSKSRLKESVDSWSVAEGNYGAEPSVDIPEGSSDTMEETLGKDIEALLSKRKKRDLPVVIFDFGGGYGVSMIRLASRFKKQVEKGELVFVVSNLGYVPSLEIDSDGYSGPAKALNKAWHHSSDPIAMSKETLDVVQQNQHLITFVQANALELPGLSVKTKKGKDIELLGAVDLIHEHYALTHVQVPDIALSVFGSLLREEGRLYLHTQQSSGFHSPVSEVVLQDGRQVSRDEVNYKKGRGLAFNVGVRLLQSKYQMTKAPPDYIPGSYATRYAVFKKEA